MSSKKTKWIVRLGESEWIRHTYARTVSDGLRLLGSVRRGAQVGALGVNEQGEFVQVVGDYLVALNRAQIARAVAAASIDTYRDVCAVQRQAVAPVIVVKRRRIPVSA